LDTVIATASFTLGTGQEVETLRTLGSATTYAANLTGNALAQTLVGNAAANVLDGKGGADTMVGYAGDDTYYVDNAADVVIEANGGGSDTVIASVSYTLGTGRYIEVLRTLGSGTSDPLNLTGNEFANTLLGNAAANVLDGKGGSDTLRGYAGNDTFAFTTALGAANVDTIVDFNATDDRMVLDDAVFTGLGLGALAAGAFVIGSAAADADDRIIYDNTTGALYFDADGLGGAAAVQFASLTGAPVIAANDFLVI
jgi:Ca2+-binding RTX toxin-like protein